MVRTKLERGGGGGGGWGGVGKIFNNVCVYCECI